MLILSGTLLALLQPYQPAFSLARSDSDLQMHLPEQSLSMSNQARSPTMLKQC